MMKTLLIPIIIICSTFEIVSQSISDEKLSVNKELITTLFQATPITDAFDLELDMSSGEYQVNRDSMLDISIPSTALELSIEALAYRQLDVDDGSKGHLKFTKGLINDLSAQGALFHKVDNYFTVAAQGSYDSWNEKEVNNKFQKDIKASLFGNYYLTDHSQLSFRLASQSMHRGVFSTLGMSDLSDTMRVKSFESTMSYSTFHHEENALNFGLGITFNTSKHENLSTKENLWTLSPYISKSVNSSLNVRLQSTNYLSKNIGMAAPYTSTTDLSLKINKTRYTITVGGTLNKGPKRLSLYPAVTANLYWDSDSYISGQVQERIRYIGLNAVTQDNPYISDSYMSPTISHIRQHSLALSNRITETVRVKTQLSYHLHRSDINWLVAVSDQRLFDIDEIDYNVWSAQASISIQPNRYINVIVNAEKNIYTITSNDRYLFYRPEHQVDIQCRIGTADGKLMMALHNHLSDRQMIGVDQNNQVVNSSYRYDSNVDISYRPFDLLSVELSANNLFNNRFEVFRAYHVFGRNYSASVLLKF